jgi:two-component system chemotaxis response regulator CheY
LDGLKVLLVDDDPFMRTTIRMILRGIGHFVVIEADGGEPALIEVVHSRPDVVLCDVEMPGMNGPQFVDKLRRHEDVDLRETPVVILTGRSEVTTVAAAAKRQIEGYLVKPVSARQLGDRLRAIAARRQVTPPGS